MELTPSQNNSNKKRKFKNQQKEILEKIKNLIVAWCKQKIQPKENFSPESFSLEELQDFANMTLKKQVKFLYTGPDTKVFKRRIIDEDRSQRASCKRAKIPENLPQDLPLILVGCRPNHYEALVPVSDPAALKKARDIEEKIFRPMPVPSPSDLSEIPPGTVDSLKKARDIEEKIFGPMPVPSSALSEIPPETVDSIWNDL